MTQTAASQTIDLLGKMQTVYRLDQRYLVNDLTDLIGLQGTDEVDIHTVLVVAVILGYQFLGTVLTQQPDTIFNRHVHPFRLHSLCDSHQLNVLLLPIGHRRCLFDVCVDRIKMRKDLLFTIQQVFHRLSQSLLLSLDHKSPGAAPDRSWLRRE